MSNMNPKVDWYFNKATKWQEEFIKLRTIILDCGLAEELKWGHPCYQVDGKNIVLMHGFKDYCAILFPKGVLLKDAKHILIQQTENVQTARQVRFTSLKDIVKLEPTLKLYVKEAIKVEKEGLKAPMKKVAEFKMAEEFKDKLEDNAALKKAFYALTPGRQRGYLLYFSSAKMAKTREERVAKCTPKILNGKGLED